MCSSSYPVLPIKKISPYAWVFEHENPGQDAQIPISLYIPVEGIQRVYNTRYKPEGSVKANPLLRKYMILESRKKNNWNCC